MTKMLLPTPSFKSSYLLIAGIESFEMVEIHIIIPSKAKYLVAEKRLQKLQCIHIKEYYVPTETMLK
jgi:pyruvoyl-dependent arginine decarboxylase (PvlArgDC)